MHVDASFFSGFTAWWVFCDRLTRTDKKIQINIDEFGLFYIEEQENGSDTNSSIHEAVASTAQQSRKHEVIKYRLY